MITIWMVVVLFEETGGIPETIDYIAQYQVHTFDNSIFKKDVYIVKVKSFKVYAFFSFFNLTTRELDAT
jgi:hypothetical protein